MKACGVEGCERPVHAYGFCGPHAHRFVLYGDPNGKPVRAERICTFPGCGRPYAARGWCHSHYKQPGEKHPIRVAHGKHDSPTYISWMEMKTRCLNPNRDNYRYYGGRGIGIDPRWLGRDGFVNFLADMGERPEGTTLDRIDPDGNYEPENCRWATWEVQNRHRDPATGRMTRRSA